ncbi:MAG: hypothetical protein WAU84_19845 [Thermoguttaceae bacterium]
MKPVRRALAYVRKMPGYLLILGWLVASVQAGESWRPWPFGDDKPGKPDRVIAMWTDTVLTRSDTPPVRGFGGRLMFYEGKNESPVKVEGMLVVYALDENGRDPSSARPDRKYVITPQQLPAHYSKSKIGHSYSVWIPWDEVGGMQKDISLIVRFEPKNGAPVVGDQRRLLLPGRMVPSRAAATAPPSATDIRAATGDSAAAGTDVRRTSYEAPVPAGEAIEQNDGGRSRRMSTSTIPVPMDMAARAPAGNWQQQAAQQPYAPPPPWWNRPSVSGTLPTYQPPQQPSQTASQASSNSTPPPVGYPLGRQRPLGAPPAPLSRDRAPWPQHPEGWPSAPASQPGSGCANGSPANQPNASPPQN